MEDIDVDDVIAFCFYVINKMRRNLINSGDLRFML